MCDVYSDILTWSKTIPVWQRDALRRLLNDSLSQTDYDELVDLCLVENGIESQLPSPLSSIPLSEDHLPVRDVITGPVTLTSIHHATNVNKLDPSSMLQFNPAGLTVIYGMNGSGKSGYSRILKQVCRSRHSDVRVYPNVYDAATATVPSAIIDYQNGALPSSCSWCHGQPSDPALSSVTVFDSRCAQVYVTHSNEVAYRPFGLDILDKLAATVDELKRTITSLANSVVVDVVIPPDKIKQHLASSGLLPINHSTDMKRVHASARFDASDETALNTLIKQMDVANPTEKIAEINIIIKNISELRLQLKTLNGLYSDEAYSELSSHIEALKLAREIYILSQSVFIADLPGTGTDPWRKMWDHAREFHTKHAYPDKPFPNIDSDAKCLLCQQPLDTLSRSRLSRFEEFVLNKASSVLADSEATIATDQKKYLDNPNLSVDEALLKVISSMCPNLDEAIRIFMDSVKGERERILPNIESCIDVKYTKCCFDIKPIDRLIASYNDQISALEQAQNPGASAAMEASHLELITGQWLLQNIASIDSAYNKLKYKHSLLQIADSLRTNAITTLSTALSHKYITANLKNSILTECDALNIYSMKVVAEFTGNKGSSKMSLNLDRKLLTNAPINDIISEGEFRAISLATFFAEISQSDDKSAIVLDDPVSSLDHHFRNLVASRIVREAANRQVIVFTHDLVFVDSLITECDIMDYTAPTIYSLFCTGLFTGYTNPGLPFIGMKARDRVVFLQHHVDSIRDLYANDPSQYEYEVYVFYNNVRRTWERVVEELLLNSIVLRHSDSIQTERLENLADDITRDDWLKVHGSIKRASGIIEAHDHSNATGTRLPPPAQLVADLKVIRDYITELNRRARSSRKQLPASSG